MLKILFEDNHLLCVVKPKNLLTQHSPDENSLEDIAKEYIKTTYNKPGNVYLHAIHRLDKLTSGIVVFAKTSKALSRLNEMMREGEYEKQYEALVEGKVSPEVGTLEHYLIHGDHKAIIAKASNKEAKKSVLHYKVVAIEGTTSRLTIRLETGRYHQIRAQFAAIGHPVVGDTLYGAKTSSPESGIMLHHAALTFCHPVTKEPIALVAHKTF